MNGFSVVVVTEKRPSYFTITDQIGLPSKNFSPASGSDTR